MNYENYKSSLMFKYSEDPFNKEQFETFFPKINGIINQINTKMEQLKNNKQFDLMLIHFKKIIELIENIKIYHRINYQLIQLNIAYINDLSTN
jgi:hypothetical protein